jgi:hypothetical protein
MAQQALPFGFWTYGQSANGLQGGATTIETLPDGREVRVKYPGNPARLEDEFILWAVRNNPVARTQYFDMIPTLDQPSQERLNGLVEKHPDYFQWPKVDQMTMEDGIQRKEVRAGVWLEVPKP